LKSGRQWSIVSLHANSKINMLLLFAWIAALIFAGLFPKKPKKRDVATKIAKN